MPVCEVANSNRAFNNQCKTHNFGTFFIENKDIMKTKNG